MAQVLALRAATDEWLDGFFGEIRLSCEPGAVDLRRVRAGQLRLCVDHNIERPIGQVTALTANGPDVTGQATLISTDATRGPIQDVNASLKAGLSFGFIVLSAKTLQEGDEAFKRDVLRVVITRWQPFELSCSAAPRGVRSRITGGLTGAPEREADAASVSVDAKTAARPKTAPTKRPRRPLNATLESETSPAPPRLPRRAVTESDYVTELIRERHTAMTASLDAITRAAPATETPPADSPDTASPLARLIQIAASPATPQVHHESGGLVMHLDAGRGWAKLPLAVAMQGPRVVRSAFDTTNTYGAIGEDTPGAIRQLVEGEAVSAVLAGVTTIEGVTGDALSAELADTPTLSAWILEGAAAVYPDPALADLGAALKPKVARTSTNYSLQAAIMGGQRFEQALDLHLRRELRRRVVQGILTGTGVNNQPTGIMSTTGVLTSEYPVADKAKLSTFFDAEEMLVGAVDAGRRWILAPDLYRLARRTAVQPPPTDADRRVIDGQLVGGETRAYETDLLPMGSGIFGALPDATLFAWETALLVIDKVTLPGVVRVSLLAYINCDVRAGSFVILQPA